LDLERGQPPARPGLLRRPLDHFARDVVPVTASALVRPARIQRLTLFVEQLARQRARRRSSVDGSVMRGPGAKQLLRLIPDAAIHDWLMLTGMPNLPVPDLT